MKRKTFISLLFLLAFSFTKAQNLVPNYSFENKIQCTTGENQFENYVSDWTGASPQYFDSLCNIPNGVVNVPINEVGYQYPHTGAAYSGIYTFIDSAYDPPDRNIRDYLQVKLNDTLKTGIKYYVTFYVSLGDSEKYACNSIGVYFSDSALVWTGYVKSYLTPQIENDTANHLTDKINWMKIAGSFIANGGEAYAIIGNFKSDKHSDTIFVNSQGHKEYIWTNAFYYIDDVIVSPDSNYADSLAAVGELKINNEELKVWPNPSKGVFTLTLPSPSGEGVSIVDVYNMMGERIYETHLPQTPKGALNTIDISNQPAGIYLYRVTTANGEAIGSGKLIIQ